MILFRVDYFSDKTEELAQKLKRLTSAPTPKHTFDKASHIPQEIDNQNANSPENYKIPMYVDGNRTWFMLNNTCYIDGPIPPKTKRLLDLYFKYDRLYYVWHKRLMNSGALEKK